MFKNAAALTHFNTMEDNTFALPYTVKEIGDSALEGAAKIKNIVFSTDIERIGKITGNTNPNLRHYTFTKPFATTSEIENNSDLYDSLLNFVPNNCPGSDDYYIHVPFETTMRSINNSPYYNVIKKNHSNSNVHISFIRPKRFNFIN
jgi:hypothetical protein